MSKQNLGSNQFIGSKQKIPRKISGLKDYNQNPIQDDKNDTDKKMDNDSFLFEYKYWLKQIWKHSIIVLNDFIHEKELPSHSSKVNVQLRKDIEDILIEENQWVSKLSKKTLDIAYNDTKLIDYLNLIPSNLLNRKCKKSVEKAFYCKPTKYVIMGGDNELHYFIQSLCSAIKRKHKIFASSFYKYSDI